jgi:PRD domain protein (TIGR03582 family)
MLKEQLEMSEAELQEARLEIERIKNILTRESIKINTQFEIGLYSHLISFIRRMRKRENIEPIDQSILSEIDKSSIQLAKEIAAPIFDKYKIPEDASEIVLISIHVQTIKTVCGGGE